jgi:hypothetical protein
MTRMKGKRPKATYAWAYSDGWGQIDTNNMNADRAQVAQLVDRDNGDTLTRVRIVPCNPNSERAELRRLLRKYEGW